jgi:hypothetical protein
MSRFHFFSRTVLTSKVQDVSDVDNFGERLSIFSENFLSGPFRKAALQIAAMWVVVELLIEGSGVEDGLAGSAAVIAGLGLFDAVIVRRSVWMESQVAEVAIVGLVLAQH